ncbi:ABC transporter ATP-binding protein [Brucella sp. NBRC 12950]|uniref:dipeptide ABC transporter ATP-binding protein n=1 Tax=Brucella sp. NBRC 12950 TaxID=2994518 RepID=UPI0024A20AB3|nr:ABC transporter ATP-binding protein [Brucella sp. NBRC 12950]GLU29257.1 ABC transporter ATP-binding protein [Brucella sp. NBRC 12950]
MTPPVLSIRNLRVEADLPDETRLLIDQVSMDLYKGEILGLVGESGSGKSLLCRSIVQLLPAKILKITSGSILLDDADLTKASESDMLAVRGKRIGMVFQNPTSHLDPVMSVGDQIAEGIRFHQGLSKATARTAAIDIMKQVGFTDPSRQYRSYPHEFSGGMRQRAMIAVALSCDPEILIADEPTTALDVTIQAQILELLMQIRDQRGLSIILITHDLGVVAQTCDRIAVMRNGKLVEQGVKEEVLSQPVHPYTKNLIASHPSLPETALGQAVLETADRPLLQVNELHVRYPVAGGILKRHATSALKGVSLEVRSGETIGIVGESGSGKSTLARAILGLTPIAEGSITFDGQVLSADRKEALSLLRRDAAMVFQDPFNSLNPRMTVGETLAEVLKVQAKINVTDIPARINELLDLVGLDQSFATRKPRSMSGGQCQRAGIARALAVEPKMIIADECIAALDVTIQAQIVELFRELKDKMKLTLLFIAHDLAVVRNLCERVVVMYHGEIVEEGLSAEVFAHPKQAYTAALIAAIPDIDPEKSLFARPVVAQAS